MGRQDYQLWNLSVPFERLLVCGFGSIAQRHISLVRAINPNLALCVLRRHKTPVNLADCNVVTSIEEALAFEPDIAIIASPAPFHGDVIRPLAARNCPLFIEKPLAHDVASGNMIMKALKSFESYVQIGYNLRYCESLRYFRTLFQSGELGACQSLSIETGQYLPDWRPGMDYRQTVSANQKLGGGVLLELSHELDYLQWIVGKPTWVTATLDNSQILQIDVEDRAKMEFGYTNHEALGELTATVKLDFLRRTPIRQFKAILEQGELIWDGIYGQVSLRKSNETVTKVLFSKQDDLRASYQLQMEDFLSKAGNRIVDKSQIHDSLVVLHMVDAAKLSSQSNLQHVCLRTIN